MTSKTTVITTTELLDCSTALSANRSSILKADRPLSHRGVSNCAGLPQLVLKKTTCDSLSMTTKNRDDDTTPEGDDDDDFEAVHDAKYAPVFVDNDDATRGGGKNHHHHPILLGEGNFGQARLMMNKSTGEKVAIKYIPRGKHLDENVVR